LLLYNFCVLLFQRDCIQFAINAKPRQRFMPEDKSTISYKMWVLVESKPFEITIMVLIALNAVVLMMSVSDSTWKMCFYYIVMVDDHLEHHSATIINNTITTTITIIISITATIINIIIIIIITIINLIIIITIIITIIIITIINIIISNTITKTITIIITIITIIINIITLITIINIS
jgi:hypothetical protein